MLMTLMEADLHLSMAGESGQMVFRELISTKAEEQEMAGSTS